MAYVLNGGKKRNKEAVVVNSRLDRDGFRDLDEELQRDIKGQVTQKTFLLAQVIPVRNRKPKKK